MIAAIYAHKSTEQTGVADEERSVTRQIEHATDHGFQPGACPSSFARSETGHASATTAVRRP
jgi:hypothetical protein